MGFRPLRCDGCHVFRFCQRANAGQRVLLLHPDRYSSDDLGTDLGAWQAQGLARDPVGRGNAQCVAHSLGAFHRNDGGIIVRTRRADVDSVCFCGHPVWAAWSAPVHTGSRALLDRQPPYPQPPQRPPCASPQIQGR